MRKALLLLALVGILFAAAAPAQAPSGSRARDILPAEGLVASSVVAIRDQAALNTHYYLADEAVLELNKKTDAVFARYRTGGREALLLAVAYPSEEGAGKVYGRFGRDFFSKRFDPKKPRFLERIETGDYAAALWTGPFLVVVLEAPDRQSCDGLLSVAGANALALLKK